MAESTQKLSVWQKVAYGLGDFGNAVGPGTIIPFWYSIFLTDIVRLDLRLVSLFWLVVTFWDAVNDPMIGYLSDRTRTRWGRRRPYLLFGAVPFGLLFAALWYIPATRNPWLLFAYYLGVYMLFEASYTAVSCPYHALAPELTQDQDERASLITYRVAVSIGAALLAPLLLGLVIFPMFPARDPRAYQTVGYISGLSFIVPLLITFLGTRERASFQVAEPLPLRQSLGFVLRNRVFRYAMALRLLSWIPVVVVQAVFAYYLIYWGGMSENETSIVQGVILGTSLVLLPLVLRLMARQDKKRAYFITMGSWALLMAALYFVPQGAVVPLYVIGAAAGLGVSAAHVIPWAMVAEAPDADELESGRRQEGVYTGMWVFIDKFTRLIVMGMLPLVLRAAHYVQPTDAVPFPTQPPEALQALRLLASFLPTVLLVISLWVVRSYPLTRERYAEIRRTLEQRRQMAAD